MDDPREERPHPLANYPAPPPRGEDLPYDDGEPMETERHRQQMNLLIETLNYAWRDRTDFYVSGNMFLYYSELQSKRNDFRGPDVFVVLDTVKRERRSWVVWEEDMRTPELVVELLSPKTESVDRGEKMRIYARILKVPIYVLYDPFTHALEVYELVPSAREYRRLAPDERGLIPCAPLGLWLGLAAGEYQGTDTTWLRWFDAAGRCLELPGEAEHRRAEAERKRAEAEKERAEAEKERADALAARVAELEALLRQR